MLQRFTYTEPQLCTYDNDITKDWFVHFNFTDTLTGHTLRKQFRGGINTIKNKEERLLQGNALRSYWKAELKAGWNPFAAKEDLPITQPTISEAMSTIPRRKESICDERTIHGKMIPLNDIQDRSFIR